MRVLSITAILISLFCSCRNGSATKDNNAKAIEEIIAGNLRTKYKGFSACKYSKGTPCINVTMPNGMRVSVVGFDISDPGRLKFNKESDLSNVDPDTLSSMDSLLSVIHAFISDLNRNHCISYISYE